MREVELLRKRIAEMEARRWFGGSSYPKDLVEFPGILHGQGFFPGGDGLWRNDPTSDIPLAREFPVGGVLVLGNDFGCADNPNPRSPGFTQCLKRSPLGFEDPATWGIKGMLTKAGLQAEQCFFTNAYLGLRSGTKSTGPSPGLKVSGFREMCAEFLRYQIEVQRPSLIVCLGHEPRRLIGSALLAKGHIWEKANISFPGLDRRCSPIVESHLQTGDHHILMRMVVIAHPSYAWSTHAQSPRSFGGFMGERAEVALLSAAWQKAQEIR